MMKYWGRLQYWILAVLVLFGAGTSVANAQRKSEIVIGYSISLTGKFSTEGSDTHRAYQIWAEEVNKQGGISVKELGGKLPVKLVHYDDSSDTNNAIRNYERLITKDEVDLLFGQRSHGVTADSQFGGHFSLLCLVLLSRWLRGWFGLLY